MLTVVCIKWGTLYGPEYVNRLADGIQRHLSVPHRFVCWTDDPTDVSRETLPLPDDGLKGWWPKVRLFDGTFNDDRVLFFDLDTVIVGNIDFLAEYDGDFAILRGYYQPFRFGSGIMSIAPGFGRHVWTEFEKSPTFAVNFCGHLGDGHWMQLCLGERDRWQDLFPGKLVSYKVHCNIGLPHNAAVVNFHGEPRPHEVDKPWMREHWIGERTSELADR